MGKKPYGFINKRRNAGKRACSRKGIPPFIYMLQAALAHRLAINIKNIAQYDKIG